jgi:hypothetical protein
MTARFSTTLGALVLGLAAFAASPVLAQGSGGSGGGGGGGNVPGQTPTTTNPGSGNSGPTGQGTQNGNPATTGTLGQSAVSGSNEQAPHMRPMHHARAMAHGGTHHMEHRAAMRSSGGDTAAGDAAVARLNEQSLMAAQKGAPFTPSGTQQ